MPSSQRDTEQFTHLWIFICGNWQSTGGPNFRKKKRRMEEGKSLTQECQLDMNLLQFKKLRLIRLGYVTLNSIGQYKVNVKVIYFTLQYLEIGFL